MRHLSPDQQLDLAEGNGDAGAMAHLSSCDQCTRDVAHLKATVSAVIDADVPEPSPLFWDHLSARVRDAVAAEPTPSAQRSGWFIWTSASVAAALAVVMLLASWPVSRSATPVENAPAVSQVTPMLAPAVEPAVVRPVAADDASLTLLAELASDLDWDAAAEAGLAIPAGSVDRVVVELSDVEREELHRLLTAEMTGHAL